MMETTTVAGPTNGASVGITSGAVCGLTATTTAATSPTVSGDGLRRRPCRAQAVISLPGCGSIAAIFSGAKPSASQPSSMALPILPAPARRMVPDRLLSEFADELMTAAPEPRPYARPWLCRTINGRRTAPSDHDRGAIDAQDGSACASDVYACPWVSNMAALSASRAGLPAQTTNW